MLNLKDMTKAQLVATVKDLHQGGYSKLNKKGLITFINWCYVNAESFLLNSKEYVSSVVELNQLIGRC